MVTYLIIVSLLGWGSSIFYAARGGEFFEPGYLIFGMLWSMLNLYLILHFGVPPVL